MILAAFKLRENKLIVKEYVMQLDRFFSKSLK